MDILYDTLIVGGGPAGLSAAIHLAWHQRKVLVIDRVTGPLFFTLEKLWNVPGMPEATGVEIQKKLKAQALAMGAELQHASVVTAAGKEEDFLLTGSKGETWRSRTLLLATGVARYHPTVDGDFSPCFAYAGKGNLFYCSDCEGPELFGKDTIVIGIGQPDWAASTAVGLSRYTPRLRLLLTGDPGATGESTLSPQWAERLQGRSIPVLIGEIKRLIGDRHMLTGLELQDGTTLDAEAFFVSSPARGRTDLAEQLGVTIAKTGTHAETQSQRGDTNVPGVWVAGDLRPISQQVAVAMGTGNIAALMIDQHLRKKDVAPPR
ncbi:MAG TPA: NAD(P)/FAD-dependent oxidoreductase [Thermoanaerobaculia bacterium]|jgi:thioredoxin reductase|nr:NAD(P)/FAD-dependent oxidoreductase [Thermoanaerobaculia bacterium]